MSIEISDLGIKFFFTSDAKIIEICACALRMQSVGGYIIRNGEPIAVINMHYSKPNGHLRVRIDYVDAVMPPPDMRETYQ